MHEQTNAAGPCLLFVNGACKDDYDSVRQWLKMSRFNTYEAADVFDAVEELYDFMGSEMPNVIVVNGSNDTDTISHLIDERVFVYSSGARRPGCINDLRQLADKLNTCFPPTVPSKRASA